MVSKHVIKSYKGLGLLLGSPIIDRVCRDTASICVSHVKFGSQSLFKDVSTIMVVSFMFLRLFYLFMARDNIRLNSWVILSYQIAPWSRVSSYILQLASFADNFNPECKIRLSTICMNSKVCQKETQQIFYFFLPQIIPFSNFLVVFSYLVSSLLYLSSWMMSWNTLWMTQWPRTC